MKEKITKKIEILGISENEVDEREEKINNELKGLTREEFEEFKLYFNSESHKFHISSLINVKHLSKTIFILYKSFIQYLIKVSNKKY